MKKFLSLVVSLFACTVYGEVVPPLMKFTFDTVKKTKPEDFGKEDSFRFRELSYDDSKITLSGSRQPTQDFLEKIAEKAKALGRKLYVVDLRQEVHFLAPFTLNEVEKLVPVSLHTENFSYNWFKPTYTVIAQENETVEAIKKNVGLDVYFIPKKLKDEVPQKYSIDARKIITEKQAVEALGATYVRFGATDHQRPTDEMVDQFIDFFRSLPKESWIHVHCRGGRGRATTFMILFDMIQTKASKPLDAYYDSHKALGGSDIRKIREDRGPYGAAHMKARFELVNHFYKYVQAPDGFSKGESWRSWLKANPMPLQMPLETVVGEAPKS
jgi:hypothetical protein